MTRHLVDNRGFVLGVTPMRTTACSVSLLLRACTSLRQTARGPPDRDARLRRVDWRGRRSDGRRRRRAGRRPPPAARGGPQLPEWKHGQNPFVGAKYWTDPYSPAFLKSKLFRTTNPTDSALLAKIADNGGADWIGDWTPNVGNWVGKRVTAILKTGSLPLFIVYNIPKRDCGQYSAGGAEKAEQYKKWITAFANGIGNRRAAIIFEPDGLGLLNKEKCLSEADKKERLELYKFAIATFMALGNTAVYLDAGHSGWMPAQQMAGLLKQAGIDQVGRLFAQRVQLQGHRDRDQIRQGDLQARRQQAVRDRHQPQRQRAPDGRVQEPGQRDLLVQPARARARLAPHRPDCRPAGPRLPLAQEARRVGRHLQRRPEGRGVLARKSARAVPQRQVLDRP